MEGILSFTTIGGDKVRAGLAALVAHMQDLRPFWRDVFAPKYYAALQDQFATGGRPRGSSGRFTGGAWAPLTPAYKVWKEQHFPGQPKLVRGGALRESVRWGGSAPGAGGIFDAQPTFVIAGTSVPYGKYHQYGTSKMPARPFMLAPDPAWVTPLLQQWLLKVNA